MSLLSLVMTFKTCGRVSWCGLPLKTLFRILMGEVKDSTKDRQVLI